MVQSTQLAEKGQNQ